MLRISSASAGNAFVRHCINVVGLGVFGLLAAIAVAATLLPTIPSKQWYIRIFDYPRLQTFVIAVAALGWYGIFYFRREKKGIAVVGALVAVAAVQGIKAWPYTPLARKQVLPAERADCEATVTLFICNVMQKNTAYQTVVQAIRAYDPDIVITTESDSVWHRELAVIESSFPHRIAVPQNNTYGMHVFSKLPLAASDVRYLVEPDIPSIRTRVQLRNGEWVTLYVVHPRPPVPSEASDTKERDAELVLVAREAKKNSGAVIVAGDFNDVAWSATTELFQKTSGLLDPRRGRGFFNTYHAQVPVFRWPLDHIFHSEHFRLVDIERVGSVNSDHFPMYVKLSFEPDVKAEQPAVQPDADTEKEAAKTIQKGKSDAE